ncbi:hypothetical protein PCASD_04366 [Puccinia coronata f. sp. avenae]|uniref:3'-5' exonuclease domain-containing protein n=1 Tax=Puccinia coronata f. sp. avenae TaxID=200324 RepID=A0A2N5VCU2_9BASI|nr:hypothetical protein PCASD_04366 [Puccinia coronata f. sp. avenae]
MDIHFLLDNSSNEPGSQAGRLLKSSHVLNTSSHKYPVPCGPASVDSSEPSYPPSPKSCQASCAGTAAVSSTTPRSLTNKHTSRRRLSAPLISSWSGSVIHSSTGCSSRQKATYAWRKIMHEYFKSDDEDFLSSDDEWWLGSNKPFTEKEEPPSGKTRPIKQSAEKGLAEISHGDLDPDPANLVTETGSSESRTGENLSAGAPQSLVSSDVLTVPTAPSSSLTAVSPVKTASHSQTLTSSDFPSLSGGQTSLSPVTVNEHLSLRLPDGPWKNTKPKLSTTGFPSLKSNTRPQPSYPTTRFVCSYSSATNQASTGTSPTALNPQESKRTAADLRDESLKATLPEFKLDDPAFGRQTITLCPSEQHPISELPLLIKALCRDGLSLPSGRPELEGGPYVAIAFDMEWTISRVKGRENKTAVIQLASLSQVLIVQISSDAPWRTQGIMPSSLVEFLVNPQIVKIGVGIRNDGLKLIRDHRLGPKPFLNSFLELSRLARALSQPDCASGYSRLIALQQIVADHLKVYLPKVDTRKSDWTKPLVDAQIHYAACDVIATIRVTQCLFKLFEGRIRRADSGLMILQYIESLEPTFERSAPPSQPFVSDEEKASTKLFKTKALYKAKSTAVPACEKNGILPESHDSVVPALTDANFPELQDTARPQNKDHRTKNSLGPAPAHHKQWRTIVPASGPQSIEVKKKWVTQPARFLAASLKNLEDGVSSNVQQAWELWYHEGLSINSGAKLMEIHAVRFAICLGKMAIHLKLNKLNLDDYYLKRIQARIANPQAFAHLAIMRKNPGGVADERTEADCSVNGGLGTELTQEVHKGAVICSDEDKVQGEHSEGNNDLVKEENQPSPSIENTPQNLSATRRPHSSSLFSGDQTNENSPVAVKPSSLSSSSSDDKFTEYESVGEGPSSCATDTTSDNLPLAVKILPSASSDSVAENMQEDGSREDCEKVKDWFEETDVIFRGEQRTGTNPPDQLDQEPGEPAADQKELDLEGEGAPRLKTAAPPTKNFKIDDSEFVKNHSLGDEPLFEEQEWERIQQINREKTELLVAVVKGFRLPQRLRTSAYYFKLSRTSLSCDT